MSEISEQELKLAAERCLNGGDESWSCSSDYYKSKQHANDNDIVAKFVIDELARRDAERVERERPIDAEWCLANGAEFSAEWYWFDEGVQVRPIAGGKWLVIVSGRMLDWSATCVGQLDDLRKALKGGVA